MKTGIVAVIRGDERYGNKERDVRTLIFVAYQIKQIHSSSSSQVARFLLQILGHQVKERWGATWARQLTNSQQIYSCHDQLLDISVCMVLCTCLINCQAVHGHTKKGISTGPFPSYLSLQHKPTCKGDFWSPLSSGLHHTSLTTPHFCSAINPRWDSKMGT